MIAAGVANTMGAHFEVFGLLKNSWAQVTLTTMAVPQYPR
jgi:hypothetical protein